MGSPVTEFVTTPETLAGWSVAAGGVCAKAAAHTAVSPASTLLLRLRIGVLLRNHFNILGDPVALFDFELLGRRGYLLHNLGLVDVGSVEHVNREQSVFAGTDAVEAVFTVLPNALHMFGIAAEFQLLGIVKQKYNTERTGELLAFRIEQPSGNLRAVGAHSDFDFRAPRSVRQLQHVTGYRSAVERQLADVRVLRQRIDVQGEAASGDSGDMERAVLVHFARRRLTKTERPGGFQPHCPLFCGCARTGQGACEFQRTGQFAGACEGEFQVRQISVELDLERWALHRIRVVHGHRRQAVCAWLQARKCEPAIRAYADALRTGDTALVPHWLHLNSDTVAAFRDSTDYARHREHSLQRSARQVDLNAGFGAGLHFHHRRLIFGGRAGVPGGRIIGRGRSIGTYLRALTSTDSAASLRGGFHVVFPRREDHAELAAIVRITVAGSCFRQIHGSHRGIGGCGFRLHHHTLRWVSVFIHHPAHDHRVRCHFQLEVGNGFACFYRDGGERQHALLLPRVYEAPVLRHQDIGARLQRGNGKVPGAVAHGAVGISRTIEGKPDQPHMYAFHGLLGYGVGCHAFKRGRLPGQTGAGKENQRG